VSTAEDVVYELVQNCLRCVRNGNYISSDVRFSPVPSSSLVYWGCAPHSELGSSSSAKVPLHQHFIKWFNGAWVSWRSLPPDLPHGYGLRQLTLTLRNLLSLLPNFPLAPSPAAVKDAAQLLLDGRRRL